MTRDRYYLTSGQAAATLGITRATLYAYASRGQLHSEAVPGRWRERRYHRDDVERLRERKETRRDPARAAARGLHWGGPVLESGITLIQDGRLYYRGYDAVTLAATASLEQVAELLWAAEGTDHDRLFSQSPILSLRQLAELRACAKNPPTLLQAALPVAARADAASYDLRPTAVRLTGARIMRLLAAVVAQRDCAEPIHQTLQRAWAPRREGVGEVIRTALVLCADHELNVSAFTARCAASAGASPYDVVSAAMATLRGYRHGGAADRVLALADQAGTPKSARAAMAMQLRRGEGIPGFGHPLYPSGDPRAAQLIRLAEAGGNDAVWQSFHHLLKAGEALLQDLPNLDFGLAAVTRAYGWPAEAPLLLFALGRTTGWIAHAIEEYESGQLIRPRARYTGPQPLGYDV